MRRRSVWAAAGVVALGALGVLLALRGGGGGIPARLTERQLHELRFPDGNLKERREVIESEDGKLVVDGVRTLYHADGTTKRMEMEYRKGRQDGRGLIWNADGAKSIEGKFRDGKREGEVISYHPNGRVASIGTFAAGLPKGHHVFYLEDGRKFEDGSFVEGKRVGTWKLYDEGDKVTEVEYVNGKPKR